MRIEQYEREKEVDFDGDKYLVRDNGAVYRKHKPCRRRSKLDDIWTFGRHVKSSGYMYIGSHTIHRIVAFAFLGNPPSEKHIVDHIDTNRSNNSAINLRWVTRLDNLLRHPSTRNIIITAYGSLENFFEDPSLPKNLEQDIKWLSSVSKEEALKSKEQLMKWADSDGHPKHGNLINRVYGIRHKESQLSEKILDIQSLTFLAVQRRWKTPTEFPSCPKELGSDPLGQYERNLCTGAVFSRDRYKEVFVEMVEQSDRGLIVLTNKKQDDALKPWAVAKVTIENRKFVHESAGFFFELNGAKKVYFKLLDIPFQGEPIDEYM